ncbi:hypothetical protein BT63DRAFT_185843 [Microthyrium microscopicum]|uniref:Uncharacterized protein n=1 Tax=Microthyrium microscopicum TaxID=703497 RepID=A0A6A6UKG3_9PEZI|nr:hypothetical protein BT63DRAFT_185843 [Microthyrium microscopicum]
MFLAVLTFTAIASALAVPSTELVERQLGSQSANQTILQPVTTKKLTSITFPQSVREKLIWGPFKLSAANGKHNGQLDKGSDTFNTILGGLCSDCYILKADYNIADKEGTRLTLNEGVYLHHAIVMDTSQTQPGMPLTAVCSAKELADGAAALAKGSSNGMASSSGMGMSGHSHSRRSVSSPNTQAMIHQKRQSGAANSFPVPATLITKGNEDKIAYYAAPNSTLKTGFWLGKGQHVATTIDAVNYRNETKDMYFTIDYEYTPFPQGKPKDHLDVAMSIMSSNGCGGLAFHPPKDKSVTYTSNQWDVAIDGYMLNILPHLHDGAVDLQILVNGKSTCRSQAIYTPSADKFDGKQWESITGYTTCDKPIQVKKGDKIFMTSEYDLTKHNLRPTTQDHGEAEGMAVAFFQFARDNKQ